MSRKDRNLSPNHVDRFGSLKNLKGSQSFRKRMGAPAALGRGGFSVGELEVWTSSKLSLWRLGGG